MNPDPQELTYGSLQIGDPRDGTQKWPWTVVVYQDIEGDKISFEVTGIPYTAPSPSESYQATLIFQNPTGAPPSADIFRINWQVMNGPVALVTVDDLVCINCET